MRFLAILIISLCCQISAFAQVDQEELRREMDKMQKEMQEQLQNLDFEQFQFDTLIFKSFPFSEELNGQNFIMPNDIDVNEMLKMMERQMGQLDMEGMMKMMEESLGKMDFSEMEKMMEPFMQGEFFMIPSPEELDKQNDKKEEVPKKENKKKRKTYKM